MYHAVHWCNNLKMSRSAKRESDRKEPGRYRLGDPIDGELEDFCKAMLDAKQSVVIRAAVSAFIKAELDRNEGIRQRYEALRRARREKTAPNLHVIKPEKEC
jgi:hypothetical protein